MGIEAKAIGIKIETINPIILREAAYFLVFKPIVCKPD